MQLEPGTRLGPYEVVGAIGAGGMGEVYRARDTRLDRTVALKVLPAFFASDPDRLARFEREAKTLAALNHPNVAQIFGVVELPARAESDSAGSDGGGYALAMEFVDGEDISQRLARGPLPIDEAIAIARQIADGLEAAHEQGIVHRDLKPANVKVRPDGTAKVLDFGLAKADNADAARSFSSASPSASGQGAANSPTFTSPAHLRGSGGPGTEMGVILGTAAYMSPEQARGKAVDKRTDIWAFGCVLYEMLTGRTAFGGETVTDMIATVLTRDPDWSQLPAQTPLSVRRLLERCLQRDPKRRLRDIGDAAIELDAAADEAGSVYVVAQRMTWRHVALPAIAILALVAAASAAIAWRLARPAPPLLTHLSITPPPGTTLFAWNTQQTAAISPDGSRVAFLVNSPDKLMTRSLDGFHATELKDAGSDPRGPTFSPDSAWIAYIAGDAGSARYLAKMPAGGGTPVRICSLPGAIRGITWGRDDTIVFGTPVAGKGLFKVSASGGDPAELTTPDGSTGEFGHDWPHALPDGQHVLFRIRRSGGVDASDIALLSVDTGKWSVLIKSATAPQYVSTGHLLYSSGGRLHAIAFDLSALAVRGDPVVMIDQVVTKNTGAAEFGVSANGTLMYIAGHVQARMASLVWRDRTGQSTPIDVQRAPYGESALSPDSRQLAVTMSEGGQRVGLWLLDLERDTLSLVTPVGVEATRPTWGVDGKSIAFWSPNAAGNGKPGGIFSISASGAGPPTRLTEAESGERQYPEAWTPDGRSLIFSRLVGAGGSRTGDSDLYHLALGVTPAVAPLLAVAGAQREPRLSPDGRWLAYLSFESSSEPQLYVRPYPNINGSRILVSSGSAIGASWRRDGRELIYADADEMFAVPVSEEGGALVVGKPVTLMRFEPGSGILDVAADGQRFLFASERDDSVDAREIRIVLNWFDQLKAKVKVQ
jgi:serine/threonine protein kinase/Tol biopolymer transport system component